jgi:16S rRNA (uracil1498-N3)-methyltransferase
MMAQFSDRISDRNFAALPPEASPLHRSWQRVAIAPDQLPVSPQAGRPITVALSRDQTRYLTKVLRLQPGDRFIALLDHPQPESLPTNLVANLAAQSTWWEAVIIDATHAELIAPLPVPPERSPEVWLVAAVPKGSGFDEVVRQCTEAGVAVIVPLVSDRTVAQPKDAKVERWQRIAREAAEQSERVAIPRIELPQPWDGAIARLPAAAHRYLAATRHDAPHLLSQCRQDAQSLITSGSPAPQTADASRPTLVIAIGPEGGWIAAEVERAIAAKFVPVSLGTTILRAVTAPVVAVAVAIAAWEEAIASRRSG